MQRKSTAALDFTDALNALPQNLIIGYKKLKREILQRSRHFHPLLMVIWIEIYHLKSLPISPISKKNLKYVPEITNVRKPFSIPEEKVQDDLQDELINLRNDTASKDMSDHLSICEFWARVCVSYLVSQRYA